MRWFFALICQLLCCIPMSLAQPVAPALIEDAKNPSSHLNEWRSGIYRIEVLEGGVLGSNGAPPLFTFQIIETLRPSQLEGNAIQQAITARWIENPAGGKQWLSYKLNLDQWAAIPSSSVAKGTTAIIAFTPSSIAMVTFEGYYADTTSNVAFIKANMKLRPLTDKFAEFAFYLTLLLPFIALALCYFKPLPSLCLAGLSAILFFVYNASIPVSSNIRVDLLASLPAMACAALAAVLSMFFLYRRHRRIQVRTKP
jgi:hypothetical protein